MKTYLVNQMPVRLRWKIHFEVKRSPLLSFFTLALTITARKEQESYCIGWINSNSRALTYFACSPNPSWSHDLLHYWIKVTKSMLLLIKRSVNYTPLTRQTLNSLAREPSSLKDRRHKPKGKMESLYAATGINKTNKKTKTRLWMPFLSIVNPSSSLFTAGSISRMTTPGHVLIGGERMVY